MLVLTRKTDEEILIGDDIKITLVRVKGNTVRLGIDAPREIRVVRGELQACEEPKADQLSEHEGPFAHPQEDLGKHARLKPANRLPQPEGDLVGRAAKEPHLFVGKVNRASGEASLSRAPLSGFVSAS